ncbi:hypothetical protein D3C83_69210 [compost metagenome]
MRPSAVRTTTVLREMAAGEITSPATELVQTSLPVAASYASTSPLSVPTMRRPSPASMPLESFFLVSTRDTILPDSSSSVTTAPSSEAA